MLNFKGIIDDQTLFLLRMKEIDDQQRDLMDKLLRRNRRRRQPNPEDPEEVNDLEDMLRRARELIDESDLFHQRQLEIAK